MTTRIPPRLALVLVMVAGTAAFTAGTMRRPPEAWSIYLANFLFWTGLSAGGVVFAALLELTHAKWSGPLRPIAKRFAAFLPVSVVLYLPLLAGVQTVFPWAIRPPTAHPIWYTLPAFAARDISALVILAVSSIWFTRRTPARDHADRSPSRVTPAAVSLLIAYALAFSLLAVDLIMSLQPGWVSTLFPAYIFTGNLYGAIAAVGLVAAARSRLPGERLRLDESRSSDLGKLLLAFALLWVYLYWSQFLTIWYGNLPREFEFVVARIRGRWSAVAWAVFLLCFAIPFVALLARAGRRPAPLVLVAAASLAGLWLERFELVAAGHRVDLSVTWIGAGATLAFAALFVLTQIRQPAANPSG